MDVSLFTDVLAIAALIAGAAVIVLGAGARESLRLLREDNSDLRRRITTLEDKENDCQSRLSRLEAENAILRDLVSGQSAIAALGTQLEGYFQELKRSLARDE